VIGFGAPFGLPFTAFFHAQELLAGAPPGDLWLEAGEFFEVLLEHPLSLPYLFAGLFAIGYTLRASRSNFSYLPMLLLVSSYTVFELFPIGFSPYRTIVPDAGSILLLGPPVALLVGSFLAGLVNRQALRWGIGLPAACALPILIAYL
jgi:hypothetical protein